MQPAQAANNDVEWLVAACRRSLWRRRLVTTSGWWLLVPAVFSMVLALVHRGATSLDARWTVPMAVSILIVVAIWRIVATRPWFSQVLLEADRAAGSDALIASAWPLMGSGGAHASWSVALVQQAALNAARAARTGFADKLLPQPGALTGTAAALMAGALLVLALPGKAPDMAVVTVAPAATAAITPPASSKQPGGRAPASDNSTRPASLSGPRETALETAQQPSGHAARAENQAGAQSSQGGNAPAATSAQTPGAPAAVASAPQRIEQIDIQRRGQPLSAAPGAAGQQTSSDSAASPGDVEAAAVAQQATDANTPVEADPLMRHYLSNWQRSQETTQ